MSNLELRIEEEANLGLTISDSSDMSFNAVDFVGVPFAPTVEVEDIVGGHRVSITSMGAEGKKTDEFDVMDGATWLSGNILIGELAEAAVLTADDAYAAPPESVEVFGKSTQAGTPTPDAPVAIQSVDNLTLYVCGFNVWDEQWDVGSLNANGEKTLSTTTIRSKNYIPVLPSVTYYAIVLDNGAIGRVCFYDADKVHIADADIYIPAGGRVFTTPASASYLLFVSSATYGPTYSNDICINISDTSRNGTYAPYVGQSVSIPLNNHIARSLPDGTRDELVLSYIGPSTEHEGLGVFSAELVQRTEHVVIDGSGTETYSVGTAGTYNRNVVVMRAGWINAGHPDAANSLYIAMCDRLEAKNTAYNTWTTPGISGWTDSSASFVFGFPNDVAFSDQATFRTWLASNPLTIDYKLATPVTHDLGTVELPILPNPLTAWADGGSAQPTLAMGYEQDINIVIGELRSAIADMATS